MPEGERERTHGHPLHLLVYCNRLAPEAYKLDKSIIHTYDSTCDSVFENFDLIPSNVYKNEMQAWPA